MAKSRPARVEYEDVNGEVQVLNFHGVISEDHGASATITKYPVQTGYHVTNQSIRENRKVSIDAVVSNMRMGNVVVGDLTAADSDYGSTNHQRAAYEIMTALVNGGVYCTVITNLTIYYNVLFDKFRTKQKEGRVDSMHFTLSGEETVSVSEDNYIAPTPISWTEVSDADRPTLVEALRVAGFEVGTCEELRESSYIDGDSFVLEDVDELGNPVSTTYVYTGKDPATGESQYEIHYSEEAAAVTMYDTETIVTRDECAEESFEDALLGGVDQVAGCLLAKGTDIVLDAVEDVIDTALGKVTQSLYGVYYDAIALGGGSQSVGGALISAGIGCVVRGVTGNEDGFDYQPGESLPTTDQIMTGAGEGLGLIDPPPQKFTLHQIRCGNCGKSDETDVEEGLLPLGNLY